MVVLLTFRAAATAATWVSPLASVPHTTVVYVGVLHAAVWWLVPYTAPVWLHGGLSTLLLDSPN